jgi:chaperonin cofactor prefoldin
VDLQAVTKRFAKAQQHMDDHHFSGVRRAALEDSVKDIPELIEEIERLTNDR